MPENSVIFFDGICNLCNGAVQFVIERDRQNYFKFAALQSEFAKNALSNAELKVKHGDSFVLLENGKVYEQSTAALKVARKLSGLWPLLYGFIVVPPFIRNAIYKFIARNRYKWFGKQESCWVPTPELKSKFLT
ncbi:MAG: DCC1-like thiol-disulfide oxidoreductase family protein [Pedobacter sp.]|uniref:thiol-disulfide oxidoreductase DCC family protein n=1 Tax=Pedobacter sp. TaxID=1411316 RepID=UPI00280A42BE|nr:DCC1-like thiol-disulfide oxidoreductase family protein [Pedobacter sp.]MDQ8006668.1 DCC1-like thiol-disulfide oxidoreductase family protein [Pedobacter sp.]